MSAFRNLRVLVVGFGSAGRRHFRNLQTLGVRHIAFCRTGLSTLPTTELEGFHVCDSMERALEWKPDAAVIATPSSLHMTAALAAASAGAHLYIEKPLSDSLDGAGELRTLCERRNLVVMIGCQFRFHPLLRELRDAVARGDLGTVLSARAEYGDSLAHWHPWEDHRRSYGARPELGGGVILTLIHPLDYLYWMFGDARRVYAVVRRAPYLETSVPDDLADLLIEFDGPVAQVHLDFVQRPPVHTLAIAGDKGRAALDFLAGTLDWHARDRSARTDAPAGFERNTMFVDAMRSFLESVIARQAASIPLDDGIAVLKMALEARDHARQ